MSKKDYMPEYISAANELIENRRNMIQEIMDNISELNKAIGSDYLRADFYNETSDRENRNKALESAAKREEKLKELKEKYLTIQNTADRDISILSKLIVEMQQY